MKRILLAASEAIPFAKTGGVADVVGSLPKYVDKSEYDVRVIMPKYGLIDADLKKKMKFICQFTVNMNWRRQYVGILKAEFDGVKFYFVDNEYYFSGDRLYGDLRWDVERFAYFSKAVLESLQYIDWVPNIIECNDWQTGLIPVFLKAAYGSDSFYHGIKTIMTIHNLHYQGRENIDYVKEVTGLPAHIFNSNELEAYGAASLLKGGIVYADQITTVSPSYAEEIMTQLGGEGLHGLMTARCDSMTGILNGLDYNLYDPMKDKVLWNHFDAETASEIRKKNKLEMQKLSGLPQDENVFMIGIVSHLTDQKGMDLISSVLGEILDTVKCQVVVLGQGEHKYEEMFRYFQTLYPEQLNSYIGFSEGRANQIYASCDAFLMPSQYEPCGLGQMMAMRYGALPIVRETGGLKDTVDAYNQYEGSGTGFTFRDYNSYDMLHVVRMAASVYYNKPDDWKALQKRAMSTDFSWKTSARKYEAIYDEMSDFLK